VCSLQHAWRNFLSRSLADFLLDGVVDSIFAVPFSRVAKAIGVGGERLGGL
jgi:hypothetical protein